MVVFSHYLLFPPKEFWIISFLLSDKVLSPGDEMCLQLFKSSSVWQCQVPPDATDGWAFDGQWSGREWGTSRLRPQTSLYYHILRGGLAELQTLSSQKMVRMFYLMVLGKEILTHTYYFNYGSIHHAWRIELFVVWDDVKRDNECQKRDSCKRLKYLPVLLW